MNKILRYSFVALLAMVFGNVMAEDTEVTFIFNTVEGLQELGIAAPAASSQTEFKNLSPANQVTKGGVTMTTTDGASTTTRVFQSNDGKYTFRCYKNGGSFTFSLSDNTKKIKSIVFNVSLASGVTVSSGSLSGTTWTGSAETVTFTIGANNVNNVGTITVTFGEEASGFVASPIITGEATFDVEESITIAADGGDADAIYYTTDGTAPTASSTPYTAAFTINATTTVKAIAVKGANTSDIAEATFVRVTPAAGGTVDNPLTVEQALQFIATLKDKTSKEVYVTGTVLADGLTINTEKGYANFKISDGTNALTLYNIKGLQNKNITTDDHVKANDAVVAYGPLVNYSGTTPEMTSKGYIYSLNGSTGEVYQPTGDGSKANPYTVTDLLNMPLPEATEAAEGQKKVWVKGYVVGFMYNNSIITSGDNLTDSNILLAAEATETAFAQTAPVQLNTDARKAALGIKTNPSLLGKEVAVYGFNLKYSNVSGVKTITNYTIEGKHHVTVAETTNGTVDPMSANAAEGEKVYVTITPDDGYELAVPTVNDALTTDKVEVVFGQEDVGGVLKHYIVMPGCNIKVTVKFQKKETVLWSNDEGVVADWNDAANVAKEDLTNLKIGDIVTVYMKDVIATATKDNYEAQVQIRDGWWNAIEGGNVLVANQTKTSFTMTGDMVTIVKARGLMISGNNYKVTKVTVKEGDYTGSEYSVFVGSKTSWVSINEAHAMIANGGYNGEGNVWQNGIAEGDVIRVTSTETPGFTEDSYIDLQYADKSNNYTWTKLEGITPTPTDTGFDFTVNAANINNLMTNGFIVNQAGYTITQIEIIPKDVVSGINTIAVNKAENGVRYNLAGQKVNAGYKGVVIMNGKKVMQK